MTESGAGVPLDLAESRSWVKAALDRGSDRFASALCEAVSRKIDTMNTARLLVDNAHVHLAQQLTSNGQGGLNKVDAARAYLSLYPSARHSLIVESDVEESGDPGLLPPKAFIGYRVEHWAELRDGVDVAARLLSSARYPLNAFLVDESAAALGLVDNVELNPEMVELIADRTVAVFVQAFDNEAHLVLATRDPLQPSDLPR